MISDAAMAEFGDRIHSLEHVSKHFNAERRELEKVKRSLVRAMGDGVSDDILRINLRETAELTEKKLAENLSDLRNWADDVTRLMWDIQWFDIQRAKAASKGADHGDPASDDSACDTACEGPGPESPGKSFRKRTPGRRNTPCSGTYSDTKSYQFDNHSGRESEAKGEATPAQAEAMKLDALVMSIRGLIAGKRISFANTPLYNGHGDPIGIRLVIDATN